MRSSCAPPSEDCCGHRHPTDETSGRRVQPSRSGKPGGDGTPAEVIVGATRDGAAIGKFNTGLVAPGENADFIVLSANPRDNIANTRKIEKVYLRGQKVPRAAYATRWQAGFAQAAATR